MYDLRLMLESFAFSKLSGTDTQHIIKEMKKQLEMMKVAVNLRMLKHLHNMILSFMR